MNFHSANPFGVHRSNFLAKPFDDTSGDKLLDIPAEPRDLLHDPRAEISILLFRHQKDGFDCRLQLAIHQRHLEFEFKI